MAILQKSLSSLVSDMSAVWQAQTGTTTTFTDGDPLLAIWQSVAVEMDFLQAQIQIVLGLARAQTATGADLDTWMAQFNFTRLASTFATGQETFTRLTASATPITVFAGSVVQIVGGATQYVVIGDVGLPTWSAAANGYVLAVGQTTLAATIEALVAGPASNVLANTLTQFGTSIPAIDVITNPSPITNGVNGESDADFRARFILYLATLAKATKSAILAAAKSVQQGLLINLLENQRPDGSTLLGSFTVVADDGSGAPPASLITAIYNAVDATRAFSVQPFVVAPMALAVQIAISVRLVDATLAALTNPAVQNAIASMVNALGPGQRLDNSALITVALGVANVASVNASALTINAGSADLVPAITQEVRTTVGAISVSNY